MIRLGDAAGSQQNHEPNSPRKKGGIYHDWRLAGCAEFCAGFASFRRAMRVEERLVDISL